MKVAIIDYGSGNLRSAAKAFERAARESGLAAQIVVTDRAEDVSHADRIVLPGVGAFADCRAGLDAVDGMVEALESRVRRGGVPFLGICVGMQLLASRGLEKAVTPGLDWIGGEVRAIDVGQGGLKLPQIGWNTLALMRPHPLLEGLPLGPEGLHAYFVHSYHFAVDDLADRVATSDYGETVTAMIARDNIAGTQFHPEKSQTLGLTLIGNFLRWSP